MMPSNESTMYKCLRDLERSYDNGNETEIEETLRKIFALEDVDCYAMLLAILKESKHVHNTKRKSIAEVALLEFRNWLRRKGRCLILTNQQKEDAMFYLVTSGIRFMDLLCDIFQLDKGGDRAFLAKHLEYLYDSKNDPKTAAIVTVSLKLQDYVEPEELLLPLIVADKFQVAESVLKDSPKLQMRYADMLNWMCGMGEDDLLHYIQSKRRLSIVDKTKFQSKTLTKISEKVVKKYSLDPVMFPHIFRKKNLNSLRYLLSCKYKSPDSEFSKWDGLIQAAVSHDIWLQEQLIFLLAYQHKDTQYAVALARQLNIPQHVLPPRVRSDLESNTASTNLKNNMPPPVESSGNGNDYDDDDGCYDDGDGFMFASDDVTHNEMKDMRHAFNEIRVTEEYWTYPLHEGNIKFIDTCDALRCCIKIIFKGGNIIGFDGEWQPKYGRAGEKERMAIMQLAVKEEVYIIDIIAFDKSEDGQELLKDLFRKLFTSEDTVRLGFGIDSDINIITDSYPYAKDFLSRTKNFDDLLYLSRQILKLPCVVERLKIDQGSKDKERGLSQLVKQCLGKPLDKTYQVSNWEQRPLSQEQLRYAALDALCLVKVYDVFEELAEEFQIMVDTNAPTGNCQSASDFQSQVQKQKVFDGPPIRPRQLAVVCDTMLQGLGKYLRCCGVNTIILQNGEDHMKAVEVRACVPQEMCMHVPEGSTTFQVSSVFQRYNVRVTSKDIFSRCQNCNGDKYLKVKKEHMLFAFWIKNGIRPRGDFASTYNLQELRGSRQNATGIDFRNITIGNGVSLQCEFIPTAIFDKVDIFFSCEQCGKVYWEGSHFDKVTDQFSHIIVDSDDEETVSFYQDMKS